MKQTPRTLSFESPLMTVPEAAAYLRIGRSTLYSLVKEGELPQVHLLTGRSAFLKADLDDYINSRRVA